MTTTYLRPDQVPAPVARIVAAWQAGGGRPQGRFPWPRTAWIAAFPEIAELTPETGGIGREDVRLRCRDATRDPVSARQAFIVTMAWGFGTQGYGRYRTARILREPDTARRLHLVAETLHTDGAMAAYRLMANECRVKYLGPAFGTKFLYGCDPGRHRPRALILDRLVADWWETHLTIGPSAWTWDVDAYGRYLDLMEGWASRLACLPDDIETLMFREIALRLKLPWALDEIG